MIMERSRFSPSLSVGSLLAANIFAAWFAARAGIKPAELLFLYWVETWVIAGYAVLKINKAQSPLTDRETRLMRIQFLAPAAVPATSRSIRATFVRQCIVVYSVYGALLFGVLVPAISWHGNSYGSRVLSAFPSAETWPWFIFSLLVLVVSHGVSYASNFIGKAECLHTSPAHHMLQLGDRLIAMHLFLVLGFPLFGKLAASGAAAGFSQTASLIGIVFIKLIADVSAHSREHMIAQALGTAKQGGIPQFFKKHLK